MIIEVYYDFDCFFLVCGEIMISKEGYAVTK